MSDRNDIAIVGMAAHLPGSDTLEGYWANLRDGIECIRHYTPEEMLAAGESPDRLYDRNYVAAAAPLEGFERFDGDFFGFGPKESAILDPQHRQFLEVAWEALENAGHPPERFKGAIGVYAGCGIRHHGETRAVPAVRAGGAEHVRLAELGSSEGQGDLTSGAARDRGGGDDRGGGRRCAPPTLGRCAWWRCRVRTSIAWPIGSSWTGGASSPPSGCC